MSNDKTVNPLTYKRKDFYVKEVQVNAENLKAVADWCKGTVEVETSKKQKLNVPYIKVHVKDPRNEKQTKAYITDHILLAGSSFKVYTHTAFVNSFDLVPDKDRIVRLDEGQSVQIFSETA